ncbi:hypothetical protein [Aquimarina sp. AU474]|uniref:hypothetical protein n=1 Tax=Aquimarina sp. AU474 TaxID=2108529 RepID=UPI000D69C8B1|nr:hypothetical protein [Aquimarina sp. AU474]
MSYVICKQEKALKGKIVTSIVLLFSFLFLFNQTEPFLPRLILFIITLLIFGFSTSYKISSDFNNQKLFSFFGLSLFSIKLDLDFPDYISVFSASFSLNNDWSTVSALGTKERHNKVVVRFFKGNKNVTVYKTNKYQEAVEKANELRTLLNVEVHNMINE